MRKSFSLFLALAILFIMAGHAHAGYPADIIDKLSRGVTNIVLSPAEIAVQVDAEVSDAEYSFYSVPKSMLKGVVYMAGRLVVGAFETVTFFVPQDPIIPNLDLW